MTRTLKVLFLVSLMVFGFAQQGHAQLAAAGPVDPANGFPQFYTDNAGLSLAPCLDIFDAAAAQAGCVPFDPEPGIFNPLAPVVFPNNFPSEPFYWIAEPFFDLTTDPAGAVTQIRFALQAIFTGGPPLAGDQAVVQHKRFRVNVPLGGSIVINHPFGTENFTDGVAPDTPPVVDGSISVAIDEPAPVPLNFQAAAAATVFNRFLRAGTPAPLPGYIGDFAVPHTIVNGPVRNNIAISGAVTADTSLWNVAGKIFAGAAPGVLSIDRATFSRAGAAMNLDVFATSTAGATVTVTGTPGPATPVLMTGNALGKFFVSTPITAVPTSITVSSTPPGGVATVLGKAPIPDLILITRADFNVVSGVLTINAQSSDNSAPGPTLTAVGFGNLSAAGVGSFPLPAGSIPPATVTVNSSNGGTHTQDVNIVTAGGPPAPGAPVLTITRATFLSRLGNWTILGRGARAGETVTVSLVGGGPVGTSLPANRLGVWRLTVRGFQGIVTAPATVNAISSGGGTDTAPVIVR